MWGVGTLLEPALGGLFAQFGAWRWAFGAGLAGVVVDIADGGAVAAARWAFTVFAMLAVAASLTAHRAGRRQLPQ